MLEEAGILDRLDFLKDHFEVKTPEGAPSNSVETAK